MADLTLRVLDDLESVDAASWDALDHGPSPFTEYGFLRALELSGSVGREAGWQPVYILLEEQAPESAHIAGSAPETGASSVSSASAAGPGQATCAEEGSETSAETTSPADPQPPPGRLLGAVAAYIKGHSYGEYIFDWSWARASRQAGLPYYPKMVIAAPMTPATGRRLLVAPEADRETVVPALIAGVREIAEVAKCSSIHWLFCSAEEQRELAAHGFAPRASFQYHWRNHGYTTFDDFLATLTSRKRKQIRKERARAQRAIDGLEYVPGHALSPEELRKLDGFYRRTTTEHGGCEYLQPGFFQHLVELQGDRVQVARVRKDGEMIAGALLLETPQALYGRYWGCSQEIDLLHFETTCYAGIERCIRRGIPLYEAGAQGQHKLLRGFLPAPTYSAHWIRHEGFHRAIESFLREETVAVAAGMEELAGASPYRADALAAFRSPPQDQDPPNPADPQAPPKPPEGA